MSIQRMYDNGYAWVIVTTEFEAASITPDTYLYSHDPDKGWLYKVEIMGITDPEYHSPSVIWCSKIDPEGERRGFLWLKKVSAEDLLNEAVERAKKIADEYAEKFPDRVMRSIRALQHMKERLIAEQELELMLQEGKESKEK